MQKQRLFVLISTIVIVILDQLSKMQVLSFTNGQTTRENFFKIDGLLGFCYIKNEGAAFGILADHRWVFMTATSLLIIGVTAYLFFKKINDKLLLISSVMVVGGGIGNMIDRVAYGYVVDFIEFLFVDFYVFNIADSFVVVGCGLMILYIIIDSIKAYKNKEIPNE